MSEFEAFDQPENTEEDPAAEFLAREQSELAGLDDFEPSNIAENQGKQCDLFETYLLVIPIRPLWALPMRILKFVFE